MKASTAARIRVTPSLFFPPFASTTASDLSPTPRVSVQLPDETPRISRLDLKLEV